MPEIIEYRGFQFEVGSPVWERLVGGHAIPKPPDVVEVKQTWNFLGAELKGRGKK
jgi:hypothetical protein